ncbi:hypothetical protein [Mesorhizobium sp. Cs1321R2N1]|uniref:hypothetical protein n=1 Tax=Mesorhizobium sp. Cs1321R2N1 TaxID=3015174 RepID=UPI00301B6F71
MTLIGAIARLEHALASFEGEQENYRLRLDDARKRLASYLPRVGEAFAFEAELRMKREKLAEVDADLASDVEASGDKPGSDRIEA